MVEPRDQGAVARVGAEQRDGGIAGDQPDDQEHEDADAEGERQDRDDVRWRM